MPRVGERFGPYELVRQIASGGMAEVYLARSLGVSGFQKYVALKTILPSYSSDEHFVQMLVEEAKISVFLTHANIAQVFDLGRIGDTYYIAMEYVDGADLYRIMRTLTSRGQSLPVPVAAYVIHEVCAGLDYAHRCRDQVGKPLKIIHRDISPQNIIVSRAGEVKIIDFGIAKAALRARQTEVGVIKGKFYYMSPEQAWGKPLDHRTDIFSAGIVLYELLAGQMVYLEQDVGKLLEMVRRADIPPIRTKRPDVPEALEAVVMKALAKSPEHRWQTAHEFGLALQRYLVTHHPNFSVNSVQSIVESVLNPEELETSVDEPPGRRLEPFSRKDVLSVSRHSLLFSDEFTDTSFTTPERPMAKGLAVSVADQAGSEDDSFEDATLISGPPSFFEMEASRSENPVLPVYSTGKGVIMAPKPSLGQALTVGPPGESASLAAEGSPGWSEADDEEITADESPKWSETDDEEATAEKSPGWSETDDEEATAEKSPGWSETDDEEPTWVYQGGQVRGQAPLSSPTPGTGNAVMQSPAEPPGVRDIPVPPGRAGLTAGPQQPVGSLPPPPQAAPGQAIGASGLTVPPPPPPPPPDWASGYGPTAGVELVDLDEEDLRIVRSKHRLLVGLAVGVVAAGVALLVAVGWSFYQSNRPGTVEVKTVPEGASVECDGKPVPGGTPLVIRDLKPNREHYLFIRKEGYEAVRLKIWLESGERKKEMVQMRPAGSVWRVPGDGGSQ